MDHKQRADVNEYSPFKYSHVVHPSDSVVCPVDASRKLVNELLNLLGRDDPL